MGSNGLDVIDSLGIDCGAVTIDSENVNTICHGLSSVDLVNGNNTLTLFVDERSKNPHLDDTIDPDVVYSQDKDGDTLLHVAIILQNNDLISLCISKADSVLCFSIQNKLFQTPLHLAVLTRQLEVVRKLVTSGAKISTRDKDGNTTMHISCRDGLTDIAKVLVEQIKLIEFQPKICGKQDQTLQKVFSVPNYQGETCLHLAAENGHVSIVELLLDNGVDVNMKDGKTGRTILHNACVMGDILLVRALLGKKVCDINARAYDGLTPFDLARARSQEGICMVLAAAGARYGDDDTDSD